MSAGMPKLGSKISLISKADIRYEGRLLTVDPQEYTIALTNVKWFGTEDRETQFPVAPGIDVHPYVLFRQADVRIIRVADSDGSPPRDPAILKTRIQVLGGMGGQFGPLYGMGGMGAMGPMMGMGGAPNRPAMNKQPSELGGLGPIEPSAAAISNPQSAANIESLPKDQSLEDGSNDSGPEGKYNEDYECIDDNEDGKCITMYDNHVSLSVQNEGENERKVGSGHLKVIYDSDLLGARIVIKNENKEILSYSLISIDTKMQLVGKECVWAAVDYACKQPTRRTLKTLFQTTVAAQEMHQAFKEGHKCAKVANIRDFFDYHHWDVEP